MDARTVDAAPTSRLRWVLGGGLIALGLIGIAAWALASPGSVSYYATPAEITSGEIATDGKQLRLGGRVAPGTLDREGVNVSFLVTDGEAEVPVSYDGEVPDTLKEETDVIAEGTLGPDGTLVATRVLAKCSSRFVSAEDAEHLGKG